MAAMKPRTGDGPLEVTKEGRGIVMRVPLEGGGRLVVEMTQDEVDTLSEELRNLNGLTLLVTKIDTPLEVCRDPLSHHHAMRAGRSRTFEGSGDR